MILKLKYILKAAFLSQLLFSCTERSLEPRPEPEPVPIRLFTGIRTRATVDVFGDTPVCVAYGVRTGQYDGSWDGICLLYTSDAAGLCAGTAFRYADHRPGTFGRR